jgi:predicted nucleotidyltransferase
VNETSEHPNLETLLERARRRIEVEQGEIDEAKRRRAAIGAALRREFGGTIYYTGSIAHGDALTPLTDVDLGVVVPDPDHRYGPGRRGPRELKDRAADAVRRDLKATYGDLRVEVEGRKRSILVRFRDPIHAGAPDFTADIIVALDNPDGAGLLIPRWDSWDGSDPIEHTRLVLYAIDATQVRYARVVRLVKHWNRMLANPPICSWHIKVLALASIVTPGTLLDGLERWFRHAAAALKAPTPDPAHVGPDIKPITTPADAARQAGAAHALLLESIELEREGYAVLAHAKLAELFRDPQMMPAPARPAVIAQEAARLRDRSRRDDRRPIQTAPALVPQRPTVRSWAW